MGTTWSVVVPEPPDGVDAGRLQSIVDDVFAEVNARLSTYDPSSELSRFNQDESTLSVAASPMLCEVLAIAADVGNATGGAFDVTVGPLVGLWGFGSAGEATRRAPDDANIERARAQVGREKLLVDRTAGTLRKTVPELEVDVDGIAPGYAVDLVAERFEAAGVHRYLVELGGELRGRGLSPEQRPWRVAIEAPLGGERRPYALVALDGLGLSTSGDYRDVRVVDGRRVSHTIDPRTGTPVSHRLASVTVVHRTAALADAYATAFMVLGPREGHELATRLGIAALFIERSEDGRKFTEKATPSFELLRRPLD
jgi:thiamine biosynthesis lipoprotein